MLKENRLPALISSQGEGKRLIRENFVHHFHRQAFVEQAEKYLWRGKTPLLILEKHFNIDIDEFIDFRIANPIAHEFNFNC